MVSGLSLCLIVKNEEKVLGRCLDSFKGLVDEVIIVDTGSTDQTRNVAETHGARVFETPWENDFAKARNVSLEKAKGQWILWTDADDILTPENEEKIKTLLGQNPEDAAFSFMIKNSQDGVLGSVFNQVRLFPNHPGIRFQFQVHEQVLPAIQALGLKTIFTDIMILHTGYSSPEVVKKKQERNLTILAGQMDKMADNPVVTFSYAGTLVDLGRLEEAVPFYEKALALAREKKSENHIVEGVPVALAALYGRTKNFDKAREWAEKAFAMDPAHPQTNAMLGEILEAEGETTAAEDHFLKVLEAREKPTFLPVDVNAMKVLACAHLGGLYLKQGRHKEMTRVLDLAVKLKGGPPDLPSREGNALFAKGEYLKAGQAYLKAVNSAHIRDPASFLGLGKIFIIDNAPQDALNILTLGLEKWPGDEDLQMLLADLYEDLKMTQKSRPLYQTLAEHSTDPQKKEKALQKIQN